MHYASASLLHGHTHTVDTILFLMGDKRVKTVSGELRPRELQIIGNRSDEDPMAVFHLDHVHHF